MNYAIDLHEQTAKTRHTVLRIDRTRGERADRVTTTTVEAVNMGSGQWVDILYVMVANVTVGYVENGNGLKATSRDLKIRGGRKMPCYSLRLASISFQIEHQGHLIDGLKAAGYQVSVSPYGEVTVTIDGQWVRIANGKAETRQGNEHLIDACKRAYSHQIIKVTAKKYGWALKKTADNKYVATRS